VQCNIILHVTTTYGLSNKSHKISVTSNQTCMRGEVSCELFSTQQLSCSFPFSPYYLASWYDHTTTTFKRKVDTKQHSNSKPTHFSLLLLEPSEEKSWYFFIQRLFQAEKHSSEVYLCERKAAHWTNIYISSFSQQSSSTLYCYIQYKLQKIK